MARFNPTKAFRQLRAERQREKEAILAADRRKREQRAAYARCYAALNQLMHLLRHDGAGTMDLPKATALMVEYAETLPPEWVRTRVEFSKDQW
jgi:hypothetical protein